MRFLLVAALLQIAACPWAYAASVISASDLASVCQKASTAINAKGKWEGKRPDDVFAVGQCEGFLEGWMEGIDGSILSGKNGPVLVSVKRDQIHSAWDVAVALIDHVRDTPLDSGKAADTVLQSMLLESGLLSASPAPPGGDSPTSQRCEAVLESFKGSQTAYLGFTYVFNGEQWVKGADAKRYNEDTEGLEPLSDDQYDPLGELSKEKKAQILLSAAQIKTVADKFGVSYEAALQDARTQGYEVPK